MAVRVFGWSVFTLLVVMLSGGIWQWEKLMERLTPIQSTPPTHSPSEDSLGVVGDFSYLLPEEEEFSPLAFKTPAPTWQPGVRWWWPRTEYTHLSLISSLQKIKDQGFGHVTVQLTQAGLSSIKRASNRELSGSFMHRSLEKSWQLICREAHKRDIGIAWMAPILSTEPKEAMQSLLFAEIHVRGGKRIEIPIPTPQVPPGNLLTAYLEKKDFQEEEGLSWQPTPSPLLTLIAFRVDEHQRSPLFWDLTDYLKLSQDSFLYIDSYVDEAGILSWDAPPGYWDLLAVYQAPHLQHPLFYPQAAQFYLADPLAIDTSRNYSPIILPPLPATRSKQGPYSAWTSLSLPSQMWLTEQVFTTGMLQKFRKTYQYDLLPLLPALSLPGQDNFLFDILQPTRRPSYLITDQDERIRYDYTVLRNRIQWSEVEAIRRSTVHNLGIGFRGRPFGSTQDLILASKYYDVPTVNSWMSLLGSMAIRQISSGAWLHGKRRVAADAIGLPTQTGSLTVSQAKEIADHLLLDGINFIEWQGLPQKEDSATSPSPASWHPFHSPHFEGPPVASDWSAKSYLGKHAADLNRYLTRCQYSLSRGKPAVDVLVYYPFLGYPLDQTKAETSMADPQLKQWVQQIAGAGNDERQKWLKEVHPLLETLQNLGYNWAWVNDDWLNSAKVESGVLVNEESEHSQVPLLIPPLLPFGTMEQLIKLTRSGGQVLVYGRIPRRVPGYDQHTLRDSLLVGLSREIVPASRADEQVAKIFQFLGATCGNDFSA
ncbi:MAG: glycosyl hydrolase [Bacteroidota bacterium]